MRVLPWIAGLIVAMPALAQEDEAKHEWFADFDAAVEAAKKQQKDLLVDFTGSDWCGWCIKLHNEVFAHDEFLEPVTKDYVLVALDYPRAQEVKDKVPNPERNEELKNKYGISGFPTVLLMTPDGTVFGKTGYQEGGPEAYVAHLNEISATGKQALADVAELERELAAAEGDARLTVVQKATKKLAGMSSDTPGSTALAAVVKQAMMLDPDNQNGAKKPAIEALLKSGTADSEVAEAAKKLDPKNEDGLYEQVVQFELTQIRSKEELAGAIAAIQAVDELGIKDEELAQNFYTNAAFWSFRFLGKKEEAKKWAQKAIDAGADGQAKQMLDQILGG